MFWATEEDFTVAKCCKWKISFIVSRGKRRDYARNSSVCYVWWWAIDRREICICKHAQNKTPGYLHLDVPWFGDASDITSSDNNAPGTTHAQQVYAEHRLFADTKQCG